MNHETAARNAEAPWPIGAHLVTPRRGYTHHGIYIGNGMVVHYAGFSRGLCRGPVQQVSVCDFAAGRAIWVEPVTSPAFGGNEAAHRARSRLGEDGYRILTSNCEHFCNWCVYGEARSAQVQRLFAWPSAVVRLFRRTAARTNDAALVAPTRACAA